MALATIAAWSQPVSPAPAFEVASIRAADFSGGGTGVIRMDASRLELPFITLTELIPWAYRVNDYQVVSPPWTRQAIWSISAKLPDGTSQDRAPEMMQTLLRERFGLTIHHESRQQQAYTLTLAAGGPALVPALPSDVPAWDGSFPGFGFSGPLKRNGVISGRIATQANCARQYQFVPVSMPALAEALTLLLGRPVADETGRAGTFRVALEVPPEAVAGMTVNVMRANGDEPPAGGGATGSGGGRAGGRSTPEAPDGGPAPPPPGRGPVGCSDPMRLVMEGSWVAPDAALIKATRKLGLTLHLGRADIDTIVVDRLEQTPTGN
jgi:uncharacterized protein (TIGR03435 family)